MPLIFPESRCWGDAAEAGEPVGSAEDAHVAAGGGQELGTEDDAQAGHAGDHFEVLVLAKPGLDELVDLGDLLVEADHLRRQRVHHRGGQSLARQAGVLALSRLEGGLGQLVGAEDLAVSQPRLQPLAADPAEGGRRLVAGQQDERAGVGDVERTLQTGKDASELSAEPVDGASAVGDQVHAPAGEDFQLGDGLVASP
ncbi:hypothetical protein AQJ27_51415 [Streptomyces olivochromogenes]|nr:hypothetical protein AQJ27_51415 [Streptomyces olivochromogenes]